MPTNIKVGTVTGTTAAINVPCGFAPDRVTVYNGADGSCLEWFSSMADGAAFKTIAAGTRTVISSGGISKFAGNSTSAVGFTIGTDAQVNTATTLRYLAMADGPGNL